MSGSASNEQIGAAQAYEDLHVPALFGQWAPRVLDAARVEGGQHVLDVACGTGILAREAVSRVGADGVVAGVDPDAGMLAVAERLEPRVEWRAGTAASIPWPDDRFDVVVSQFGLMFFPDRKAAVREMGRVTVPGGRLAVAVWDSLENSAAYPDEVDVLERIAGRAAADALRAPFVLGDTDALVRLFDAAGIEDVTVRTHFGTARFPSVRVMVEADLRGWLPVMGVHLEEHVIQQVIETAEEALAGYVTDDGQAVFDSPAHIVTGTSP